MIGRPFVFRLMSTTPFPQNLFTDTEILRVLREHGVIEVPKENEAVSLRALPVNPRRVDRDRRRSFLLSSQGRPLAHLTVGPSLGGLHERIRAFSIACPELALRPLFFVEHDGIDYLGREYFAGETVEHLLSIGTLSQQAAGELKARALQLLDSKATASSVHAAQEEARVVFQQFAKLPTPSAIDRQILLEVTAPVILEEIARRPAIQRWSNHDFTPRNLILDTQGALRLIDHEFSRPTHFPEEDEWRWHLFSAAASAATASLPAWLEVFFWMKQMVLSHETIEPLEDAKDANHAMDRIAYQLTALLPAEGSTRSRLLRSVAHQAPLLQENQRLLASNAALTDKLARIQNSNSWKITAWLRAIRRLLTGE